MKRNSRLSMMAGILAAVMLATMASAMGNYPGEAWQVDELPGGMAWPSEPWSVTQVVSTESTSDSTNPSLAVDAEGNVHVAWHDFTNYTSSGIDADIFYKRWDATTRGWSATEVVSTESTSNSVNPSLAVDAGGNVHVAWSDLTNYGGSGPDADIFYKRKPAGGAWPAATEVVSTESTGNSQHPSLVVDAVDNVHVAWYDWTNYASSGTDPDIFYKRKPAGGAWPVVTEVVSTESTSNSLNPSLAVDAGGNIHVAWEDYTNYTSSGIDADIFYKRKPAGGAWPAVTEVVSTESTDSSYFPSLAVDVNGYVHVAWHDYTNYASSGTDLDIFYKCKVAGETWPGATEVVSTESTGDSQHPSLAVDAGGNIHVAWEDYTNYAGSGIDSDIFYKSKIIGGTWPAVTEVVSTESTDSSYFPSMSIDADGNMHVAWNDFTNYGGSGIDVDIFYKVAARILSAPVLIPITPSTSITGVIDVTWLPSNGASRYYVYRAALPILSTSGLTPLALVASTAFVDTVAANGTWYYVIVAGSVYRNTTASNCVSVVVGIPPSSNAGTIPESIFYTIVGLLTAIAILMLAIGVLAGRRDAARPLKRAARDHIPAAAAPSK